jgi:cell division transport system permease protein
MLLIGLLLFVAFFSMQYLKNIAQKMEIEVLFFPEVKEMDIVAMEQQLKLSPWVASSRVSSRAANTREAIRAIGNDYTQMIDNPINASIILSVSADRVNPDSLKAIDRQLKQNMNVKDVQYPPVIANTFTRQKTYQAVTWGICILFMLISMLLIANNIRLNIYAKRFNIKSMLLVGATRGFVRRPFVFKGFVQGVWAGFLAIIALATGLYFGNTLFPDFINFQYITLISYLLAGIFLFCILFSMLVSWFSVNKYIKIKNDRLFLS